MTRNIKITALSVITLTVATVAAVLMEKPMYEIRTEILIDAPADRVWNILTDADRTSYTIGWWMTFPAEPVRGVMVAQVNTITPKMRREGTGIWKGQLVENLEGQVFPAERSKDVLA